MPEEETSNEAAPPDDLQPMTPAFSLESTRASREPVRDIHASITREALNGKERKGRERKELKPGIIKNSIHGPIAKDDVLKIFSHWQQTMQHPQARLDNSRDKWIRRRIADGLQRG